MWQRELKQAFGIVDKRFAMHEIDKGHAREARKLIKKEGITGSEIEAETLRILEGTTEEHQQEQLDAVRKFLKL